MINGRSISITHYHPVLASFDDSDNVVPVSEYDTVAVDDVPPPLPPRSYTDVEMPVYAEVQSKVYHKELTDGEVRFMKTRLSGMNKELPGEATIKGNQLEVKSMVVHGVPNWKEEVSGIVEDHLKAMVCQTVECSKPEALEYLVYHQETHKDFYFHKSGDEYVLSGEGSSVTEAVDHVNDLVDGSGDAEVTQEIRKPPHLLDYFMKFEKEAIEAIQPPVSVTVSSSDPGLMVVEGIRESLDQVQALVNDKLACVSVEHVLLTGPAHRLFDCARGKSKLNTTLGQHLNTVHYCFERIEGDDTYTHSVYLMSANGKVLALAKRKVESLCKEEKLILTQDKSELTSTQKWNQMVIEVSCHLFVSIRTLNDTVVITGDEIDIRKVLHDIHTFMETQNEAEEEMSMETCVYQVIHSDYKMKDKLQRVIDEGSRNKVLVALPLVDEAKPCVFIRFTGNPRHIANMKVQLNHMQVEVLSKSFSVSPKPGIHKLAEKGLLRAKCMELGQSNQIVVRYSIQSDLNTGSSASSQYTQPSSNTHRAITASTHSGIQVAVCTGNYAHIQCDAFITFVPDEPKFNEPVLVSLSTHGGQEVQKGFELTLGVSKLTQGSMYITKRTGKLACRDVVHLVLPMYDLLFGASRSPYTVLMKTLQDLFYDMNRKYSEIVICPPTLPPLNYPADLYAKCLADTVVNINAGSKLNLIQVFVDDDYEVDELEAVMKKEGSYRILSRERVNTLPTFRPRQVKETGTPASLQKAVKIQTGDMFDIQVNIQCVQK